MKTLNCLIVDDEELARKLITLYIEKTTCLSLVGTAKNSIEVLSSLKKDAIDLIFLDIQMPELSGVELAKLLPEHIKIIFTSGYSRETIEEININMVDYLLKPITLKRFQEAIEKIKDT